jgi:beta-galactosidase
METTDMHAQRDKGITFMASKNIIAAALLATAVLPALAAQPQPAEWEQPEVVAVNREPMKATFFNFESREKALAGDKAASQYYQSLDGTWSFAYSATPEKRPKDFYKLSYDVSKWGHIQVPGMLQAQGYGKPIFTNIKYP